MLQYICQTLKEAIYGIVYYSGDTREINTVKALIDSGQKIDKLYMDTTTNNYPGNVHLYIGILQESIPDELKGQVYCMHLNDDNCIEQAKASGFNVVSTKKIIFKKIKNEVFYE